MSLTKRLVEQHEEDQNRTNAIEALIDCDMLEGAALGIAKKVIGENSIDKLSEAQMAVYERQIKPYFQQACQDSDCENILSFDRTAEAIRSENSGEETLCDECSYKEYVRQKDD